MGRLFRLRARPPLLVPFALITPSGCPHMRVPFRVALTLGLTLLLATLAAAADWPGWRGPNGNDTTPEVSGWPRANWPGEPVWVAQVNEGATSPIVAKGLVYVMGWKDGNDTVRCLRLADGQELWQQSYPCPRLPRFHLGDESWYKGPSPTPAYDAATGLLFTLSTDGDFACWNAKAGGKSVWRMNLHDTFNVPARPPAGGGTAHVDHGYTAAPLVTDKWVILEVGAPDATLMAFDKRTGKRAWISECKDARGQTGGLARMTVRTPTSAKGIPCVAVLTISHLLVARVDKGHEGRTLAEFPFETTNGQNTVPPEVFGDLVLLSSGLSMNKTLCLRVAPGKITQVWEGKASTRVCAPIVHRGRVYFAYGALYCVDMATGETKWSAGSFGEDGSCLLTADEKLIVWGNRKLALVDVGPGQESAYHELALRTDLGAPYSWPHVTLAEGRLLVKDDKGKLICFQVGADKH